MPDPLTEIAARLAKATPHRDLWAAAIGLFKQGLWRLLHQDDLALLSHAPTDLAYLLHRLKVAEAVCAAAKRLLDSDGHAVNCGIVGQCSCDVRFTLSGARGEVVKTLTTWQAARG